MINIGGGAKMKSADCSNTSNFCIIYMQMIRETLHILNTLSNKKILDSKLFLHIQGKNH